MKRHFFPIKKLQKGSSDLSNPYVHSIFILFLIKQIFEKKKKEIIRITSKCFENTSLKISHYPKDSGGGPEGLVLLQFKVLMTNYFFLLF